jgi:hypothetical protein
LVETIKDGENLLALIIYKEDLGPGVHFFTPPELSQQVACMNHVKGTLIQAHKHNPVPRQVQYTQEVLIIKKGLLRVDFYNNGMQYLMSKTISSGDIILLASGGHGFEVLEDLEMIEVKQGPHVGEGDKTRFEGIDSSSVILGKN